MRRYLLIAALILGSLAGFVPGGAKADHCTRILVLTGNKTVGLSYDPGDNGCKSPAAHGNTNRIMPGADQAIIRVRQAKGQPIPVGGLVTTDSKTAELSELAPNTGDPETATLFEQTVAIGSTTKLEVKVQYADGTEQTTKYTR